MPEFSPLLPTWLTVLVLVVFAFFLGRWSARSSGREPRRYHLPASAPAAPIESYNPGAGIDTPEGLSRGLDMGLEAELKSLLRANRKIEAIKVARARLGIGLKEAKDLVEAL